MQTYDAPDLVRIFWYYILMSFLFYDHYGPVMGWCILAFLRVRDTHNTLQLSAIFFFFFFSPVVSRILRNSEQKTVLQIIEQLTQYTLLEIQSRSLKYMSVTRVYKNLSYFPFPPKQIQSHNSVLM